MNINGCPHPAFREGFLAALSGPVDVLPEGMHYLPLPGHYMSSLQQRIELAAG